MGMGLALLGGALAGLGKGMAEVGEMNAKQRFEAWRDDLKAKRDAEARVQTAALNDQNDANRQYRGAVYDKQSDERAAGAAVSVKKVENEGRLTVEQLQAANAQSLETLKHRFRLDEKQAEQAQDLSNKLALAGQTADYWDVGTDGALHAYSSTGKKLGSTGAGVFNPTRAGREDEFGDPPPPPPTPPSGEPAPDDGGKTYTAADLAYTAQKNGISVDEARRRLNEAGYRQVN